MPPADLRSFLWCFFGFKGRISREPYVLGVLAMTFMASAMLLPMLQSGAEEMQIGSVLVPVLPNEAIPILILANIIQFALLIKRLHDINRSGWFSLIIVIPIIHPVINLAFALILAGIPGTAGPNRFGDGPNVPPA